MAKAKTAYFCSNCGAQYPKWLGKCSSCGEWNTINEEVISVIPGKSNTKLSRSVPVKITEVTSETSQRTDLRNDELNRVLGGGLTTGSVILVGGEPGIGKSTLLLQVSLSLENATILYVSGEESENQIKMRAERIGIVNTDTYLLSETEVSSIIDHTEKIKPTFLIVDSIQTMFTSKIESSPGTISQIRESAFELQQFAKKSGTPIFLIGHITKDGNLAGPKVLEHLVDTVLQFEGDRHQGYRILRTLKNRFGSTSELGIFEMNDKGLREVNNPSEILISQRTEDMPGAIIAVTMEGLRPLMVEVQALVSVSAFGTPQRSATGFDPRRLSMLLAVLEKKAGLRLSNRDVFLNITGGIRIDDPAVDLAVVTAVFSSYFDLPISRSICFAGEIGLAGEVRPVNRIEQRISEAQKLGFTDFFLSTFNNISAIKQNSKPLMRTINNFVEIRQIFYKGE